MSHREAALQQNGTGLPEGIEAVDISEAAAARAAELIKRRDDADTAARLFFEGLCAGLGIPLERMRGVDPESRALLVAAEEPPQEPE